MTKLQSSIGKFKETISNNRIYVLYTLSNFIFQLSYGAYMNTIGVTLVDLQYIYDTTINTITYVPTLIQFGYLIGSLAGYLYKWINRQLTWIILMTAMSIAVTLVPYCGALPILFANSILNGIACGVFGSSNSIWLVEMWGSNSPPIMQIAQFVYGLGSILGPMAASGFVQEEVDSATYTHVNYSFSGPAELLVMGDVILAPKEVSVDERKSSLFIPFLCIGIVNVLAPLMLLILYFTSPYDKSELDEQNPDVKVFRSVSVCSESLKQQKLNLKRLRKQKNIIELPDIDDIKYRNVKLGLITVCIAAYTAAETNYFFFSPAMFHLLEIKLPSAESAQVLSLLFTTYALGRLLTAFITIKVKPDIILAYHFVILFGSLLLIYVGRNSRPMIYSGTLLLGYGCSAMWPAILAFTERHMRLTDRVGSVFSFSVGLLGLIIPLLLSSLFKAHPLILLPIIGLFIFVAMICFVLCNILIYFCR